MYKAYFEDYLENMCEHNRSENLLRWEKSHLKKNKETLKMHGQLTLTHIIGQSISKSFISKLSSFLFPLEDDWSHYCKKLNYLQFYVRGKT